jgi:transcriptional regulator with XRE-family HTH domain
MSQPRRALLRVINEKYEGNRQRFADAHGFSRPAVSMWCSGERTPGLVNAHRLEAVAGIPWMSWLSAAARRSFASTT